MIYRFFLFKSAGIENGSLSVATRMKFTARGIRGFEFQWPGQAVMEVCAPFDFAWCRTVLAEDPVLSRLPACRFSEEWHYGSETPSRRHDMGLVVKCHVRDRENMFAALLGFARKHGLSIADPCFGLILLTSEREDIRGSTWLRLRRQQVTEWFSQTNSKVGLICLGTHLAEDYYVAVHGPRYGTVTSSSAVRFRETVKETLFPDEKLEFHQGRIVLVGPGGAYKIHFDWEGCGKNAGWTADFRDADCPIIPLGRISARMLRRKYSRDRGFPVGMFDPRVVACIPDPGDRYASLALFNHKLTKRVPRDVVEELKRKREEKHD